jgi:hypothetical protein
LNEHNFVAIFEEEDDDDDNIRETIKQWWIKKNVHFREIESLWGFVKTYRLESFETSIFLLGSENFTLSDTVISSNARKRLTTWKNESCLAVIFYFIDYSKKNINIVGVSLPQLSSCKITKCCDDLHIKDLLLHDRVFYRSRHHVEKFFPDGRIINTKHNLCNIPHHVGDDGLLVFDDDHSWFIGVMFKFSKYYDQFMKSSQDQRNKKALFQEIRQFFKDYKPKESNNNNDNDSYNYQYTSSSGSSSSSNSDVTSCSDDDELFREINMFVDQVEDNTVMSDDYSSSKESKYAPLYREAVEKLKFFTDTTSNSKQRALFKGTEWVVQRMCARDEILKSIVEKGLRIWYSYCFDYCFPLEVDFRRILNACNISELSKVLKSIPLKESSECLSREEINWIQQQFSKKHPNLPLPSRVYVVPWLHALSLVSERSVIVKSGKVYFTYADTVEWLMGKWNNSVYEWQKWDQENIFQPLMKKYINKKSGDWSRSPKQVWDKAIMKIWRDQFWKDFKKPHPLAELFFNFDNMSEKSDGRFLDSEDATLELFQSTVNNWWLRRKDVVKNINQRRLVSRLKSSSDIQHIVIKQSRTFQEDWLPLLPPCISNSIQNCFKNKTHLTDKQRLFVFKFLYHKGVPLEDAEQMWFDMCRADPKTRCARFTTVEQFVQQSGEFGHYPRNHYQAQEKVQSSEAYKGGFMSCESVKKYYPGNCPFTDIEDLGKRKNTCANVCWKRVNRGSSSSSSSSSTTSISNNNSPWKNYKFWSPSID